MNQTNYINRKSFDKWEQNHFLEELKAEIGSPFMRPRAWSKEIVPLIDPETGEETTRMFVREEAVDREKFVKVYCEGLRMLDIGGAAQKVLAYVLLIYAETKMYGDRFYMNYNLATKAGYDRKPASWINGVNKLIHARVLNPAVMPSFYYINPKYVYKGNRITLIRDYTLKTSEQEGGNPYVMPRLLPVGA